MRCILNAALNQFLLQPPCPRKCDYVSHYNKPRFRNDHQALVHAHSSVVGTIFPGRGWFDRPCAQLLYIVQPVRKYRGMKVRGKVHADVSCASTVRDSTTEEKDAVSSESTLASCAQP
jgi:hypothetical protein